MQWIVVAVLGLVACQPVVTDPAPAPGGGGGGGGGGAAAAPALCASQSTPDANDHAAFVVVDATGEPEVVEFEADSSAEVNQEVAELEQDGRVLAVEREQPVSALVTPGDDPQFSQQWGFQASQANFPGAWGTPVDGTGVRVAVIDTGVQATHPDVDANVVAGKDFVTSDAGSNFGRLDGHGHGTHVAGTIAAEDNTEGVVGGAPKATVVPVRVLNCDGTGGSGAVAAGIDWAADQRPGFGQADVISLSLGGPASSVMANAISDAIASGVVVVAAAGNNHDDNDAQANEPVYPASYPGVISVGALQQTPSRIVRFPGSADTINAPANSFTTQDFDFVARIQANDWTPATPQVVASKYDSTIGTGYEPLRLNSNGTFTFSALLQTPTSTIPSPIVADGSTRWVRVLRQGTTISFSMAPDTTGAVPTTWPINLGTVASALPGDLLPNLGALVVADGQAGGSPLQGFVKFAALRTNPTTTPTQVVVFDATTPSVGATTWTSTTGETWNLHGSAAVVADARAPYSNTSSNVAIAAAGSVVRSTCGKNGTPPTYCDLSGTSMAAPHVTAVVALLLQKCPAMLPADVRTRIMSTAGTVSAFLPGVGKLRADAALAAPC